VFSSKAKPSGVDLGQGVIAEVDRDVPATSKTVKLRHLFGIGVGTQMALMRDGQNLGQFTVTAYDAKSLEASFNNAFGQSLKRDRDFFVVAQIQTAPANMTVPIRARSPGEWGDEIQVRARPMSGGTVNLKFSAILNDPQAVHRVTQTAFTYTW